MWEDTEDQKRKVNRGLREGILGKKVEYYGHVCEFCEQGKRERESLA